jgi:hypothetical protein
MQSFRLYVSAILRLAWGSYTPVCIYVYVVKALTLWVAFYLSIMTQHRNPIP